MLWPNKPCMICLFLLVATETTITDVKTTPETPAVVTTTRGVTLADKLRLNELPLATTPGGKNFTLKALHPSEHTIKAARVPGGNKTSVALCCDMIETFAIANANSRVTVVLQPNIVVPAMVEVAGGGLSNAGNFYNTAFGGSFKMNPAHADTAAVVANMRGKISNYRITSQSATVELIAPALSDQGTIVAAQYTLAPKTVNCSSFESSNTLEQCVADTYLYPEPVLPSAALLGTSAYTSKAREGVYMPLKLSKFKWMDFSDPCVLYSAPRANLDAGRRFSQTVANPLLFPYAEDRTGITALGMDPIPKLTSDIFGIISVEGTAANVAIRVRVRQVVEITAPPGTLYAPLVEAPLPPDRVALEMYQEISARMMDGYPASYNDLGTLMKTVMSIGKQVLPYVEPALDVMSKLPVPGVATAANMGKAVLTAGKSAAQTAKQLKKELKKARGQGKKSNAPTKPLPPTPAK